MLRENRNMHSKKDVDTKRWLSVVGFLISVSLLSFAIFLSINQENMDRLAAVNEYDVSNYTMATSSEIKSSVNNILSNKTNENKTIIANETNEVTTNNIAENITPQNQTNSEILQETSTEAYSEEESDESNQTNNEQQVEEQEEQKDHKQQFILPVNGEIYKGFSMDSLVYSDTLQEWVTHRGIDIQANLSEDVKASASGTVKSIKNDPRYGWSITIEHKDGFTTIYTCLREANLIQEGDTVEQGQIIAKVGNSGVFESADGSHLHFEMTKDGGFVNPEIYIK